MSTGGIVVGANGSAEADEALDWAVAEAASRGVPLSVVRVTTDGTDDDEDPDHVATRGWLEAAAARTGVRPEARVRVVPGPAADALLRVTAETGAEMLVLGRRRRGRLGRRVLGSVSTTVVEHARVPVTVVRHGDPHDPDDGTVVADEATRSAPRPRRVVVGVDTSPPSVAALRHGAEVAARKDAELSAVFAWQITTLAPLPGSWGWAPPLDDYERFASDMLDAAVREAGVDLPPERVVRSVVHAPAAKALVEAAGTADRLVVGHRGLGGFDRLMLGSVSRQVLDFAPCPVTVVRD
ncbi:universal stress protein [Isoptericola sp. BMS4]|uniref:universal stress protein n=1 Tax=Isoptericola sp. BMS4 TaxID=2527875 RepID=UPI00142351E8|nr:universal stress protein [Isoptericola sp. BMS4]